MDTITPIISDAFDLLCTDLYVHLDEAEFLASKADQWSRQDVDAQGGEAVELAQGGFGASTVSPRGVLAVVG